MGGNLCAVLLGENTCGLAAELGEHGADRVLVAESEDPGLDAPVRLSGADGGPIQIKPVPIDPSSLSDAELVLLEKIMERHYGSQEPLPQLNP
jgi:hypothetical protein